MAEKLNSSDLFTPRSENLSLRCARAKYVPDYVNGGLRLASVCEFSRPVFNENGDELSDPYDGFDYLRTARELYNKALDDDECGEVEKVAPERSEDSVRRATRRARLQVFDLAVCNHFDLFSTFTFSPEEVDRCSYDQTYGSFKVWLSNRVQRNGLRYVAVPEYHSDGRAIHFHMLSNASAVDFVYSGHYAHDRPVYNIKSWKKGFSTAQFIENEKSIDFVSKYIAKYMTKSNGRKVGGRYYLSGGDLKRPTYIYADSINDLVCVTVEPLYEREVVREWGTYIEKSYI